MLGVWNVMCFLRWIFNFLNDHEFTQLKETHYRWLDARNEIYFLKNRLHLYMEENYLLQKKNFLLHCLLKEKSKEERKLITHWYYLFLIHTYSSKKYQNCFGNKLHHKLFQSNFFFVLFIWSSKIQACEILLTLLHTSVIILFLH